MLVSLPGPSAGSAPAALAAGAFFWRMGCGGGSRAGRALSRGRDIEAGGTMGHSVCGVAVALYAIRNRCSHNPLAHPPWCGCTLKRAAQAGRRRALQRLRSVLSGRALSPGRVGVAAPPGRLFGPSLERCRPALLVRHGGRPGGGDGHDAPVGGACNVGAGPALDRVGHWLRCAAGRAGAAAGAMTGGTPDLIAVRAMCTGATRHLCPIGL